MDVSRAVDVAQASIQQHGQLFAFTQLSALPNGSFKAVAEYCNIESAASAVTAYLHPTVVEVSPEESPQHMPAGASNLYVASV
jgi:hypothetical protein